MSAAAVSMPEARAALAAMDSVHQLVLESSVPADVFCQWLTARSNLKVALEWAERGAVLPVSSVPEFLKVPA